MLTQLFAIAGQNGNTAQRLHVGVELERLGNRTLL